MKRCPTCNRTFEDTQTFCSEDGTRLEEEREREFDPMATIMSIPPPPIHQSEPLPPPPTPPQQQFGTGPMPGYQPPTPPSPAPTPSPTPSPFSPQPAFGAQGAMSVGGGSKLVPAVVGGLLMGFLTSIPVVGSAFCCWAWAIAGGVVAGLMYIKKSPNQVQMGEAAILGAIAGVIGGIINTVVGLPLNYLVFRGNMHSNIGSTELGPAGYLLLSGVSAFIGLIIFGAIGGLIAVPIFEKRKQMTSIPPPPPPPPQQNFGGYR